MSIGSTQQLSDSCAKITQSSTTSSSCDYSGSLNHLSRLEDSRKIRREIANSNERKRMECINTGFQALKTLLPHKENEKLSKAMILQQTAQYILTLEKDKTTLLQQNTTLKRLLANCECQNVVDAEGPSVKRQRCESHSKVSDEEQISNNMNSVCHSVQNNKNMEGRIQCEKQQNLHTFKKENKHALIGGRKTEISNDMKKPKSGQNLNSIVLAIEHLEEGETERKETPIKQNIFNVTNVHKSSKRIIL